MASVTKTWLLVDYLKQHNVRLDLETTVSQNFRVMLNKIKRKIL